MSRPLEVRVDGQPAATAPGWSLSWLDRAAGVARLSDGHRWLLAVIEGAGSDWVVTLRGRRIPVSVRTWREQVLADAASAAAQRGGPIDIRATLPGLVVALASGEGDEVAEGASLLTIEAMKMQNEVRAPRAGRVAHVAVGPGQTVATGTLLLRLE
jgi:acetyl/propionyl-CoA carboxylase alpha subunit